MHPTQHKATKMQPRADAPAGLETDGKGNVIPLDQRTPEDQAKAVGPKALKGGLEDHSVKNPDNEADDPAPMPRGGQPA